MRLMSVHPRLSVHRSQALLFCTIVHPPANLCAHRQPARPRVLSSAPRRVATFSQITSDLLVEDHMANSSHVQKAWDHWKQLGSPKFIVAPMVDQSELPFRMLCRRYGATAAYTPMLHARLFSEGSKYREEHLTTCPEDHPLFVQFCANDPDVLVTAAQHVEESADYIDLNFGCPQRIAKKGRYGAFLMDDLPCVASLVRALHERTSTPVSAKIRIFPQLSRTLEYAKLIESSGASLVAVHGRTRDQKDAASVRADWDAIKAVKDALSIPVLGNGDIQSRADAVRMMEYTGVDGVMSASPLLEDPRLFWEDRGAGEPYAPLKCFEMAQEYLKMCETYPVPIRMGHIHKIVGCWFQEHTDIRDEFNRPPELSVPYCQKTIAKLEVAVAAVGREYPVPKISDRKLARLAREEAISGAKREQEREDIAVAALEKKRAASGGAAELKNGDSSTKERVSEQKSRASDALKHPDGAEENGKLNGKGGLGSDSGAAVEAAVKQNVVECTTRTVVEPVNGLAASVRSETDQNGTSLQNLRGSRKKARLMSNANSSA